MTGERAGVAHGPKRGAAYVENWVRVLEEDPREIHRAAAAEAQRMSDYLIGRVRGGPTFSDRTTSGLAGEVWVLWENKSCK